MASRSEVQGYAVIEGVVREPGRRTAEQWSFSRLIYYFPAPRSGFSAVGEHAERTKRQLNFSSPTHEAMKQSCRADFILRQVGNNRTNNYAHQRQG